MSCLMKEHKGPLWMGMRGGSHKPDRVPPEGTWVWGAGACPAWVSHSCHQGLAKKKLKDGAGRDAGMNVSK